MFGERQCTAHSKRTGAPCQHPAMRDRTVCYQHGGRSVRGVASGRWKHGRYSKALPADLATAYERARRDPDLIALRDELALVDARLAALLQTLTTEGGAAVWADLRATWDRMEAAQRAERPAEAAQHLRRIREIVQVGTAAAQTWSEVYDTLELRRRLADTERKRLETLQAVVTAERAMALIGALAASLRQHVQDRAVLAAVTADIEAVLRTTPEVARAAG
jgi:hypothetical protein